MVPADDVDVMLHRYHVTVYDVGAGLAVQLPKFDKATESEPIAPRA